MGEAWTAEEEQVIRARVSELSAYGLALGWTTETVREALATLDRERQRAERAEEALVKLGVAIGTGTYHETMQADLEASRSLARRLREALISWHDAYSGHLKAQRVEGCPACTVLNFPEVRAL